MTRLVTEGFEEYGTGTTNLLQTPLWLNGAGGVSTTTARTGTRSLVANSDTSTGMARLVLPAQKATLFFHCGLYCATTGETGKSRTVFRLHEGTNTAAHLSLYVNDARQLILGFPAGSNSLEYSTGAIITTPIWTGPTMPLTTWQHIQFAVTLDNSLGSYTVKINGETVGSASGIDTRNGGTTGMANYITIGGPAGGVGSSPDLYFDDIIINDDAGSRNNSLEGEVKVYYLRPTADAATTDWTPNSGSTSYTQVDETTPDDDTTYVATSTVDAIDEYTFEDLPAVVTAVNHVQVVTRAKKTDAGAAQYKHRISTSTGGAPATLAESDDFYPGTTYSYHKSDYADDPDTGLTWTPSGVNGITAGVRRTV